VWARRSLSSPRHPLHQRDKAELFSFQDHTTRFRATASRSDEDQTHIFCSQIPSHLPPAISCPGMMDFLYHTVRGSDSVKSRRRKQVVWTVPANASLYLLCSRAIAHRRTCRFSPRRPTSRHAEVLSWPIPSGIESTGDTRSMVAMRDRRCSADWGGARRTGWRFPVRRVSYQPVQSKFRGLRHSQVILFTIWRIQKPPHERTRLSQNCKFPYCRVCEEPGLRAL